MEGQEVKGKEVRREGGWKAKEVIREGGWKEQRLGGEVSIGM